MAIFTLHDGRKLDYMIYGDADDILDPKMPQQLAGQLPNSVLKAWPGAGHYGFVDTDNWIEFLTEVQ